MARSPYREPGEVEEAVDPKELPTYQAACNVAADRKQQTTILFEAATTALHQLDRAHSALVRLQRLTDRLADSGVPTRWILEETERVLMQNAFFSAAVHLLTQAAGADPRTQQVEWKAPTSVEIEEVQKHFAALLRERAMDELGKDNGGR